jgi:predicted nucleic acid-binding protein
MQTLKGFDAVYCDASFFIALFSKKDAKHKRALELFKEIKKNRIIIHTCWFIISEAMTVLFYRYGYSEALTFNQLTLPPSHWVVQPFWYRQKDFFCGYPFTCHYFRGT